MDFWIRSGFSDGERFPIKRLPVWKGYTFLQALQDGIPAYAMWYNISFPWHGLLKWRHREITLFLLLTTIFPFYITTFPMLQTMPGKGLCRKAWFCFCWLSIMGFSNFPVKIKEKRKSRKIAVKSITRNRILWLNICFSNSFKEERTIICSREEFLLKMILIP